MTTATTTVSQLTEGQIVFGIGTTTFDTAHTVTNVRRYNGTTVAVISDRGGFWPINMVGADTPAVVKA